MHWIAHIESGPRRVNHAAAAVDKRIFTFGGYSSMEANAYRSKLPIDVHVLNTEKIYLDWQEIEKPKRNSPQYSVTPFQRYGHTAVAYGRKIYIWGGRNDHVACNRLFCFDTDTFLWSSPRTTGIVPYSRDGHSACIIGTCMYIFGGYEEEFERFSQEVYALDLETMYWTYIITKGESPPYTDFHTGTAIGNRMYVFGGRSDRAAPNTSEHDYYPNEIMYLDTDSCMWVSPVVSGNVPLGRRSHSAFLYNNELFIFGGYNALVNQHFNDLYKFNPFTCNWSVVKTVGVCPKERRRQVCIVVENKMYLFGGTSPIRDPVYDDGADSPDDHELMDHDDLHVLDLDPSLKTLCMLCVINNELNHSCLPTDLIQDLNLLKANLWIIDQITLQ